MAKFTLGNTTYPRKKDAVAEVRRILHAALINAPLAGDDLAIIRAVLEMHPSFPEKTAKGIGALTVRQVEFRPGIIQRCFFILHTDGTATDFSFLVALGMAPSGPTLAAAARHAVYPGMHSFKMQHFGTADTAPCAISGEPIPFKDAHVDHAPPWQFAKIVQAFAQEHGVPEVVDQDGVRIVFANDQDAERFVAFHDERASLRVVSAKINMSMGSRA